VKMKSNFEKVREFHEVFGVEVDVPFTEDLIRLRWNLIDEEATETYRELTPRKDANADEDLSRWFKIDIHMVDKEKLTKELADLLYVVYGTGVTFGLPLDEAFELVHNSNMSKLDKEGKVLRREDGKVLKSDQYKPADLSVLFNENISNGK
jgi:predicted HAD superfamily Cof-like phosphohydrolase